MLKPMPEKTKNWQIEKMWRDYEMQRDRPLAHWRKHHEGRMPVDDYRFLRNDPEADYFEVFILSD
jgi:hypothetical protein